MLKEILNEKDTTAADFEKNMSAINKIIDQAIKSKDSKTLDSLGKDLDKILKGSK